MEKHCEAITEDYAQERLPRICFTYADEVMLREAAGRNVVLQQLLGEILVHLCSLVGIDVVSEGLVQVCKNNSGVSVFRSEAPIHDAHPCWECARLALVSPESKQ